MEGDFLVLGCVEPCLANTFAIPIKRLDTDDGYRAYLPNPAAPPIYKTVIVDVVVDTPSLGAG
jgi:hypothetical protein